jgi:hypothetical protein
MHDFAIENRRNKSRNRAIAKSRNWWVAIAVFALMGCDRAGIPSPLPQAPAPASRIRATALVIRTNVLPERKGFIHLVVMANGKARIGNELDRWRLIDFQNNSVTFVDDITRTYRTESFPSLLRQKRSVIRRDLPEFVPAAEFFETDLERTFGSYPARLYAVRMGGYQRNVWMSTALDVPAQLFPLIIASEPLTTPYSPAMEDAFEGLLKLRGFPVIDRSDMVYRGEPRVIEKKLERVEQRNVPLSWFQIPASYTDLTPKAPMPPRRRSIVPDSIRRRVTTVLPGDRPSAE